MARPKKDVIRLHVSIPQSVCDQIDLYLLDPVKGKLRYGALSRITTALWLQLIRELEKPGTNPVDVLRTYGVEIGEICDVE
jgi:hypothetical protein